MDRLHLLTRFVFKLYNTVNQAQRDVVTGRQEDEEDE
jgi:hypothetical protein